MSQAFGLKIIRKDKKSNELLILVDSRISCESKGKNYVTKEHAKKYAIGTDNRLYICFGKKYAMDGALNAIGNLSMTNLRDICMKAIPADTNELSSKLAKEEKLLGVFKIDYVGDDLIARACGFKEFNESGLYEINTDLKDQSIITFGIADDADQWANKYIAKYIDEHQGVNIDDVCQAFVDEFNDSTVGGIWTLFHVTKEGVKEVRQFKSRLNDKVLYAPENSSTYIIYDSNHEHKCHGIINGVTMNTSTLNGVKVNVGGSTGNSYLNFYNAHDELYGFIRYDDQGAGNESENQHRLFICSAHGKALKIQAGDNDADMSLSARKIFMMADVRVEGELTGGTIDELKDRIRDLEEEVRALS